MSDARNIHEAYKQGDLESLKAALNYPPDFPNQRGQQGLDENCLEYAIYHSPVSFIRTLLELGADPNYDDRSFPSLIAALSTSRPDKYDIVLLLHAYGADLQQRGINDYTPLHYAANDDDPRAIELLLSLGADPDARTNVDEFATPLEEAVHLGRLRAVQALGGRDKLKIKIAFTIIDGFSRSAYTMYKLQGIPKTENLTEPENRNRKSTTNQDTSKAIYYIPRKS